MFTPTTYDGDTVELVFAPKVETFEDPHEQTAALEAARREAVWVYVDTQILPGAQWEALLRDHPPKQPGFDYDPATFPQALLVASIVRWKAVQHGEVIDSGEAPTVAEVATMWESWPEWARAQLLRRCEDQNQTGNTLGKAIRLRSARAAVGASATRKSVASPTDTD